MTSPAVTPTPRRGDPAHALWLAAEAEALFAFYQPHLIVAAGGFATLDERGRPMPAESERPLHETTRMVHCFAIARLLGRKGADDIIDHGMKAIRGLHRDARPRRLFLVVRRPRPARARQARLRPRPRPARGRERQMRRPPGRRRADRRHRRGDRNALLGAAARGERRGIPLRPPCTGSGRGIGCRPRHGGSPGKTVRQASITPLAISCVSRDGWTRG